MVPNHKDIGDLFKQQLDAMDFQMSENAWSAIEPHLPKKEKKRRGIIWFWFAALLCISGLGLTIYNSNYNSNPHTFPKASGISKNPLNQKFTPKSKHEILPEADLGKTKEYGNFEAGSTSHPNNRKSKEKLRVSNKPNDRDLFSLLELKKTEEVSSHQKENIATNFGTDGTLFCEEIDSLCPEISITKKPKRELKKNLSKPEEEKTASSKSTLWCIPYAGPLQMQSTGIDRMLVSNTALKKSSDVTLTYGVLFRWMLSENWGLQLGIGKLKGQQRFNFKNQNLQFNFYNVESPYTQNELSTLFVNQDTIVLHRNVIYWEVPIEAYYQRNYKHWNFGISSGLSYMMQTKNEIIGTNTSGNAIYLGNVFTDTRNSMALNSKVHISYLLAKNWRIEVAPAFQFHFMTNQQQTQAQNYFFSLRMGISCQLPF